MMSKIEKFQAYTSSLKESYRLRLPQRLTQCLDEHPTTAITEVELHRVELPETGQKYWFALRLSTKEASGLGFTHSKIFTLKGVDLAMAQTSLRNLLIGKKPADLESIWNTALSQKLSPGILWLADTALWDLLAKTYDVPVYKLLGGSRNRIPAYFSSKSNLPDHNAYVEDLKECQDRGYHGYKVHPYTTISGNNYPETVSGDAERDMDLARYLRAASPSSYPLMWDNFKSYSLEESIEVGQLLGSLDYLWFESPMEENDVDSMTKHIALCKEIEIPVCGPEHNSGGYWSRLEWLDAGACDIARIDPNYGGFTGCMVLAIECEKRGVPLELHNHNLNIYNLQVIASAKATTIQYLECFDHAGSEYLDKSGFASIPDVAGLGQPAGAHRLEF